ncbi:unnamed protein product [Phytomonas sp. Hart1]|nr:unnamed protein product [Phytomonas sp. Hart1]|eukprot:CCW68826.1 unnamed protein product [Phytomonas sp. isolate Hart1]
MPNSGFIDYAHLRLREAHPGPCQYDLKSVIGPNSDSLKKSIFNRPKDNGTSLANSAAVGPGSYIIASSIGTGSAADFGPHSSNTDPKTFSQIKSVTFGSNSASAKSAQRSRNASPNLLKPSSEIKKEILEARQPLYGSPAFTMRGRLKGYFDVNPNNVCSGTYTLPSCFDSPTRKNRLKGTFSGRYETAEEREKKLIPGPGAYNVTPVTSGRAISILGRTDRCATSGGRKEGSARISGSGHSAYGDPTTISHRLHKQVSPYQQFSGVSTFGNRPDSSRDDYRSSMLPGPGAYNITQAADFLDPLKNHSSVVMRSPTVLNTSARQKDRLKGGGKGGSNSWRAAENEYYCITLPSDFSQDSRKGVKILGRNWPDQCNSINNMQDDRNIKSSNSTRPCTQRIGSFHLSEQYARTLPSGGRFASRPYGAESSDDIQKRSASRDGKDKNPLGQDIKDSAPGPANYDLKYNAVQPRSPCAILSGSPHACVEMANAELAAAQQYDTYGVSLSGKRMNTSPGPGHYHPDNKLIYPKICSTIFYKGDFHTRNGMPLGTMAEAATYPGSGMHYNDTTLYSRSIASDVAHGLHAKTFGTRFPARALYQVCKPQDKATNTNCIYSDEYAFYFGLIKTNDKPVQ